MSRRIHVVGIGGAGMSAIARILSQRGELVTGSDLEPSPFANRLQAEGIEIHYGHDADLVRGADLVLTSAAVPADNVELVEARNEGIAVVRRDEFWDELAGNKRTLAVAGTHGKTTTTGLVAWILEKSGADPSYIVGGELLDFGANSKAGQGGDFIIEADEYQLAFLGLQPETAVVTNVEHDHPDEFPSTAAIRGAFQSFVDQVERRVILCADDEGARSLATSGKERVTYGLSQEAGWRAEEIRPNGAGGSDFLALRDGEVLGLARTRLPGTHNVLNALAALAMAQAAGVSFTDAREALTGFHGVARRFQLLGEEDEVTVIDDYAHHPTEVRATLQAAVDRYPERRLLVVFQPHTYSRTKRFLSQLAGAFDEADGVIVTDIYASREEPDPEIEAGQLVAIMDHVCARHVGGLEEAAKALLEEVEPGDVVITMSAGDGDKVGRLLLEGLMDRKRRSQHG